MYKKYMKFQVNIESRSKILRETDKPTCDGEISAFTEINSEKRGQESHKFIQNITKKIEKCERESRGFIQNIPNNLSKKNIYFQEV